MLYFHSNCIAFISKILKILFEIFAISSEICSRFAVLTLNAVLVNLLLFPNGTFIVISTFSLWSFFLITGELPRLGVVT